MRHGNRTRFRRDRMCSWNRDKTGRNGLRQHPCQVPSRRARGAHQRSLTQNAKTSKRMAILHGLSEGLLVERSYKVSYKVLRRSHSRKADGRFMLGFSRSPPVWRLRASKNMCTNPKGAKKEEHSPNMEHLLLVCPKDRAQKAPESVCQDEPLLLLFANSTAHSWIHMQQCMHFLCYFEVPCISHKASNSDSEPFASLKVFGLDCCSSKSPDTVGMQTRLTSPWAPAQNSQSDTCDT